MDIGSKKFIDEMTKFEEISKIYNENVIA